MRRLVKKLKSLFLRMIQTTPPLEKHLKKMKGQKKRSLGIKRFLPEHLQRSSWMNVKNIAYSTVNSIVSEVFNTGQFSAPAFGIGDGQIRIWQMGGREMFNLTSIHAKMNQSKAMSLAWHFHSDWLLAFGIDTGRVGWVEALGFSSYQNRGVVYTLSYGGRGWRVWIMIR